MANWASVKAAAEAGPINQALTIEIALTDPETSHTASGWYTASRTLYLTDKDILGRTSSGSDNEYFPAVKSWGDVDEVGDIGAGLQSVTDFTVTLKNDPLIPQKPGSEITGAQALSPEPFGDRLRLSEFVRLWEWQGAAVTLRQLWFETGQDDQATYAYQSAILFSGKIENARVLAETIELDIVQNTEAEDSALKGRTITDPPYQKGTSYTAPICYGNFSPGAAELNGFAKNLAVWITGRSPVTPAVPFERDGSDAKDWYLIWNDSKYVNGTKQANFGGGFPDDADIYRFDPGSGAVTLVLQAASDADGSCVWQDTANTDGEHLIKVNKYLKGRTHVPGTVVEASTGLTYPDRCIDRSVLTYAELDATDTANYVDLRIADCPAMGTLFPDTDNVFLGWIAFLASTVDAGTEFDFGPYVLGTGWLGTQRTIDDTDVASTDLMYSAPGGDIPKEALWYDSGGGSYFSEQPIMGWQWRYFTGTATKDVVMRIAVSAIPASPTAGQHLKIVGAGFQIRHYVSDLTRAAVVANASEGRNVGSRSGYSYPGVTPPGSTRPGHLTNSHSRTLKNNMGNLAADVAYSSIMVDPEETTDDDASGTITGSASSLLTSPAHQAAHMILSRGEGAASTDLILAASTFGSFRDAKTALDVWLDQVDGASSESWSTIFSDNDGTSSVADAVNTLCQDSPMMVVRQNDGKFHAIVYPAGAAPSALQYNDSASNRVKFHPNTLHSGGTQYGQPFTLSGFAPDLTPLSDVANNIRVNYKPSYSDGRLTEYVYANKDDYRVWDHGNSAFEAHADSNTLGELIYARCGASEDRYGFRRELVVDAPTIYDNATATALLAYLVTRFALRRILVSGYTGLEAYDLKRGHVVKVSNDFNLVVPMPKYGGDDWEDEDFMVLERRLDTSSGAPLVWFRAEQLYPCPS